MSGNPLLHPAGEHLSQSVRKVPEIVIHEEGGDAAMNPSAAVGRATVFLGKALRV